MSKLWILLLFVGAIQFARAYPALEEDDNEDIAEIFDLSSVEYDIDDLSGEGKVKEWFQKKWDKFRNKFFKLKKKVAEAVKKGKDCLKRKGINIGPLNCINNKCRVCVDMTSSKKKYCGDAEFKKDSITLSLTKQKDQEEPQTVLGPFKLNLKGDSNCLKKPMGKVIGPICVAGLKGSITSTDGKPYINFCAVIFMKRWNVGVKTCCGYHNGKFQFKFSPKLFAGEVEGDKIVEGGENQDEGKVIDAVPE